MLVVVVELVTGLLLCCLWKLILPISGIVVIRLDFSLCKGIAALIKQRYFFIFYL